MKIREFIENRPFSSAYDIVRINGKFFPKLPLTNIEPRAQFPSKLGSIIFLGSHSRSTERHELKPLIERCFAECKNIKSKSYVIILGKTDWDLGQEIAQEIPSNVVKVYGSNLTHFHPKLRYLPMGRDFRSLSAFATVPPKIDRCSLCYANFSVSTHPIRPQCRDICQSLNYIKTDHMGNFLDYPISREEFCRRLSQSKFCVCPRGNGVESFRMWDSLYYGVIPIVVDEAVLFDDLRDLPILFLNSMTELQTFEPEHLNMIFAEYSEIDWNYEKLDVRYWLRQVWSDYLEHCVA